MQHQKLLKIITEAHLEFIDGCDKVCCCCNNSSLLVVIFIHSNSRVLLNCFVYIIYKALVFSKFLQACVELTEGVFRFAYECIE